MFGLAKFIHGQMRPFLEIENGKEYEYNCDGLFIID